MNTQNEELQKSKEAYEQALKARSELKKDYNTWMNFFYIINGAVLLAMTSDNVSEYGRIILSVVGLVVSIAWLLSCRGYRYWVDSWTRIVLLREREYFGEEKVYGVLAEETKESCKPLGTNNISTAKILQVISLFAILVWNIVLSYLSVDKIYEIIQKSIGILTLYLLITLLLIIVGIVWIKSDTTNHKKIKTAKIEN